MHFHGILVCERHRRIKNFPITGHPGGYEPQRLWFVSGSLNLFHVVSPQSLRSLSNKRHKMPQKIIKKLPTYHRVRIKDQKLTSQSQKIKVWIVLGSNDPLQSMSKKQNSHLKKIKVNAGMQAVLSLLSRLGLDDLWSGVQQDGVGVWSGSEGSITVVEVSL